MMKRQNAADTRVRKVASAGGQRGVEIVKSSMQLGVVVQCQWEGGAERGDGFGECNVRKLEMNQR